MANRNFEEDLEDEIDRIGLESVLYMIAGILDEKSDHVLSYSDSDVLSEELQSAANEIREMADTFHGISF